MNKQLYTFSYVCVTSGAAAFVFSAFYLLVYNLNRSFCSFVRNKHDHDHLICISPTFFPPPFSTSGYISWQVDVMDTKFLFLPFKWIGMNAMLVFVMAAEGIFAGFINGWYYHDPHNSLVCLYHYYFLNFPFSWKGWSLEDELFTSSRSTPLSLCYNNWNILSLFIVWYPGLIARLGFLFLTGETS